MTVKVRYTSDRAVLITYTDVISITNTSHYYVIIQEQDNGYMLANTIEKELYYLEVDKQHEKDNK